MTRISSSIESIKEHYDVVVVGSGYGAGIAASRLSRAGKKVCILERGREIRPGDYPNTLPKGAEDVQVNNPDGQVGSRTGLFDFHVNKDMNVLVGCGLGGTSLINANVSLEAEPRVFENPNWPKAVVADLGTRIGDGYKRAREMLKPNPYPDDFPKLPKHEALKQSAADLGQPFYSAPINVTFKDGVNHVGVEQKACTLCGDCVSGCNYGAKNTTLMNYLPDATNHGAEIFTEVSVRHLERKNDRWLVHYQLLKTGREKFDAPTMFVSADIVMLGAGTLGSTEILLRSREKGLSMSDWIGRHFSGNGDVLGFGYNGDQKINGMGMGHHNPAKMDPVGPCITGVIDHREQPKLEDGMVCEEGSIPGCMGPILPEIFGFAAAIGGKDQETTLKGKIAAGARELGSFVEGPYRGALSRTQTYLVMTHDGSHGDMRLEDDRLRVDWPGVGKEPIFEKVNTELENVNRHLGGQFVKNPIWSKLLNDSLISVHPLGGCIMAEDASRGVTSHKGEVFSGTSGEDVHDGLYVCDGAIVPCSLGVNPLLTISALAERICAILAEDRGLTINYDLPSQPAKPAAPLKPGVQFTETMTGTFAKTPDLDFAEAAAQGKKENSPFTFTLTIQSDDVAEMISNPKHAARIVGSVIAPKLSPQPLTVTNGEFCLFIKDESNVATRNMTYRMTLTSEDGKSYGFDGYKVIVDDPIGDMWPATTTLYFTVYNGADEASGVLGKGILHIKPVDFMKQMTTMKVVNAKNELERLEWLAKFGEFFAGKLFHTYGGIAVPTKYFNNAAPPRVRRPLRAGTPEVHYFATADKVRLKLTRYRGGDEGPIILSPGLGITSGMFSTDTVDTTLVEYLYAAGYDTWLFDWRGSPALESSRTQFTLDEVARNDYQAAIPVVLKETGAKEVDMMVHCIGSTSFFMAMLLGLEGVRSVVASQSALHLVGGTMDEILMHLHVPTLLDTLGIKALTAVVDNKATWEDRIWDKLMELNSMVEAQGMCSNPICHRATFMYGPNYLHSNLNQATHDTLHELFGSTNMTVYKQLGNCVRNVEVLNADGDNTYFPQLERLKKVPITFFSGALNELWLPVSTEKTYDLLCDRFGGDTYSRFVVPGYAHADNFMGKNAANDVFPLILENLKRMRTL